MGWCYVCVSCEWVLCVYEKSRYMYIVLGGYMHIFCAPRLVCVLLLDLDLSRHHPFFYEEQRQPSSMPGFPKHGKSEAGSFDAICTSTCQNHL